MKVYGVGAARGFNVIVPVSDYPPPHAFDCSPLKLNWRPIEMEIVSPYKGTEDSDCPHWFGGVIVCSAKAVSLLANSLGPVEILPLTCRPNRFGFSYDYSIVNILDLVDCIDRERSKLELYPSTGRVMSIEKYVFDASRLHGHTLFKVPEQRTVAVFATDAFVKRYRSTGLEGLAFEHVFSVKGT